MPTVRIAIVGDESTGKSSLITSLVKDTFVSSKITAVLPHITIPPSLVDGGSNNVTTVLVDTSALPQDRPVLAKEIRKSNVILLVYSDHYSYERVALFWLPYFRSLGVSLPIVLCANKSDLVQNGEKVVEEEMLPVMSEWKEIDSCIRTSAREHFNVNEAFFLCQKAVTHPVAPLFDAKESQLKPACAQALNRIFYLCDKDRDGLLNDAELQAFQRKCFDKELQEDDLAYIKDTVETMLPDEDMKDGINPAGFLLLNRLYAEKGRHETIWIILRTFQYTDSLSLMETFLHPKFDVPEFCSAELSPSGYQFFIDLFLTSSHDSNGGLTDQELARIFAPTPGIPPSWTEEGFPSCTVRNEVGHVTLQGWLAQWSMTTFTSPKTTLEYLAYLGFESPDKSNRSTTAALKVTKPRKRRRKAGRVQRNVVFAQVLGSPHSGKSSILDTFLGRMSLETYHPTIHPRIVVNTVELPGGKQIYLILQELGESSTATLDNEQKLLHQTDLLVFVYDSSDPDSFKHVPALHRSHPHLKELPSLYVALKADLDRTTQRCEVQPDEYVAGVLRMPQGPPIHTSVKWPTIQELYVSIAEACLEPTGALPKPLEDEDSGKILRYGLAFGALVCAVGGAVWVWKRAWGESN